MPLLASVVTEVEAPTPPPEPRPRPVPPETPFMTWTPTGGEMRILGRGGEARMLAGLIGLDMPPEEQFESPLPQSDGSILTSRRRLPRELIFPMSIRANTLTEFEAKRRRLIRDFDPARDGVFAWALPDGTRRDLLCRLTEMTPEDGHPGVLNVASWRMVLRAQDPYWYGEEQIVSFNLGAGGPFYPVPFTISPSTTTGDSTIHIDGEVETPPEAVLRGPMTTATLKNRDTNKTLSITPNLSAGQTLTVRMDPRTPPTRRFTRETGVSVWGSVAGDFPVFWSLEPGDNRVTILAAGTSSTSRVELHYRPRYLSA